MFRYPGPVPNETSKVPETGEVGILLVMVVVPATL
jgi:hypothetical protein